MQEPFWKIVSKEGKTNLVRAQIKKGHISININGNPVLNQHFSGAKNVFPFTILEIAYSLHLRNKPVGGYDYSLVDPNGNEIQALDLNPSVAVAEEARRIADYVDELNEIELEFLFPQLRSEAIKARKSFTMRDQLYRDIRRKKQIIKQLGYVCPYCGVQLPDLKNKCFALGKSSSDRNSVSNQGILNKKNIQVSTFVVKMYLITNCH